MLNLVWLILIVFSVIVGGLTGRMDAVGEGAFKGVGIGVDTAAKLIGFMTLWLGLMRLADKAGLVRQLGLAMRPIMVWLYPEVPPKHPAMGSILMNMAANILGLNNAATPLGLRAMQELERLNPRPGTATNAMCMLLAINTSSITLIPVTIIALLTTAGATNPTVVIGTTLAASIITHIASIAACKFLERMPWYYLPPPTAEEQARLKENAPKGLDAMVAGALGEKKDAPPPEEDNSWDKDDAPPWVPHAGRILAVIWGLIIAIWVITALPEIAGFQRASALAPAPATWVPMGDHSFAGTIAFFRALDDNLWAHPGFVARRFVDALALMAVPLLIALFPLYAAMRRIPVYDEFVEGAKEGIQVAIRILPFIVGMLTAVTMFRNCGGLEGITMLVAPVAKLVFFPPELVPMSILRPFTSGGALALFTEMLSTKGPNDILTIMAGTIYGSSETTFYVLAVYFGSVNVRRTRHALPAGLFADFIGPIACVVVCRMMLG